MTNITISKKIYGWGISILFLLAGCVEQPSTQFPQPTQTIIGDIPEKTAAPTEVTAEIVKDLVDGSEPNEKEETETIALNPLTGLPVQKGLLNRRPILVKIENLPRSNRPQWGLSLADLVFEYHTEEGTTRFAAIYYGQNSEKVGPIRSGRIFDIQLLQMYKPIFFFGSAYETVFEAIARHYDNKLLVVEGPYTAPALFRYEPNGRNYLLLDMYALDEIFEFFKIDNSPQQLNGMLFDEKPPENGLQANQIYIRFSSAIYNRWDYDESTQKYTRFSDVDNAYSPSEEVYEPLTDRLTTSPITADNIVVIMAKNFLVADNIYDIDLMGTGNAFLARDGMIYDLSWKRLQEDHVLTLAYQNGKPAPFKPGQTWFEVISDPAIVEKNQHAWRFTFLMPTE